MLFLIKISLYFSLSFLVLSIPVKNQTLFFHLSKITAPYTQTVVYKATDFTFKSFKTGRHYITNIFSNSNPKDFHKIKTRIERDLPTELD